MRLFFLLSLALLTTCCSTPTSPIPSKLCGDWVQPIPGHPGRLQGIRLLPNGVAESINMHTLRYSKWELDGDRLTLTGKSIGNQHSAIFSITPSFALLRQDTLILKFSDRQETYMRVARTQNQSN